MTGHAELKGTDPTFIGIFTERKGVRLTLALLANKPDTFFRRRNVKIACRPYSLFLVEANIYLCRNGFARRLESPLADGFRGAGDEYVPGLRG